MAGLLLGDQLGIAGLSLGAFSTTCDIFKAISTGMEVWHRVQSSEIDVGYFRAQLILQKDVMDSWYRDWYGSMVNSPGYAGRMRMLKLHQNTVDSTLRHVQTELAQLDPVRVLHTEVEKHTLREQMQWIVSQRDNAENALHRIGKLLQGLYQILPLQTPHPQAQVIMSVLNDPNPGAAQLRDDLVRSGEDHSMLRNVHILQQLREGLDKDLEERVKAFQQKLSGQSARIQTVLGLKPEERAAGTRSRKRDGSKEILVEWKEYSFSYGENAIRLNGRCENLAKMLQSESCPPELLTLRCHGFFDDKEKKRFGFVFDSPATSGQELVSLNELFQRPPAAQLPTLEERYQMTYSLGLALSIVFTIGWLHKGLRSHNILFLRRGDEVQWARPYLVGFASSREDKPDALSEKAQNSARFNLYRHPDSQYNSKDSYRQEHDIYSFGVILFEIASWRPSFPIWDRDPDAAAFRKELCSPDNRKRVAHSMGIDYCHAMLECLDGTLPTVDGTLIKSFFMRVVEQLRR